MFERLREKIHTVRAISAGPLTALWNSTVLTCLPLQRRLEKAVPIHFPLLVHLFGRTVRVFVGPGSDYTVFCEVFLSKAYDIEVKVAPKVIIDLGGNVGFSAVYFATRFPEATIFTLEPEPRNFLRLQRNVRGFKNIRAFQLAVAGQRGSLILFSHPRRGMGTSIAARAGSQQISVPAVTLDQFMEEQGIDTVDVLKFDVEGAELDVFRASTSLDRITTLVGEVHEDLMPGTWSDFAGLFSRFRISDQQIAPSRRLVVAARLETGHA
jgi:FkbM family methyltransferase